VQGCKVEFSQTNKKEKKREKVEGEFFSPFFLFFDTDFTEEGIRLFLSQSLKWKWKVFNK